MIADLNGQIEGVFSVPADVPAGSKLVSFRGSETTANATFVGRGTLATEELRLVTEIVRTVNAPLGWGGFPPACYTDPLAQTFSLMSDYQLAAVDVWFCAVGDTPVLVQVRGVSLGLPTQDVYAQTMLPASEVSLDGPTRFRFTPTMLEAGRDYALVIGCNDATSTVAIAELGAFDPDAQKWVTSQPYQIGVLLSSSNNVTWSAHQTKDLKFRLIAADYDVVTNTVLDGATTKTVVLDPVDVVDADIFVVNAAVDRPTSDDDVAFDVAFGALAYRVAEGQVVTLPERYTGEVTLSAVLSGTHRSSPRLHRDVQLVTAKQLDSSDYVSRVVQCGTGSKITVYYDAFMPNSASVDAFYADDAGDWVALPIIEGIELGDGWIEVKREAEDLDQPETRVKLVLSGSAIDLPFVKNLRVAVI